MKWEREAEREVRNVPFFVRKRVRRRVEEEAASRGDSRVTLEHVRACQQRFLNRMEEEVQGYQVETCFGPTGCPNRAVSWEGLAGKLEGILDGRNLREFLKERVPGELKMHHELRLSCSDCPNACSRPQIADVGMIGACRPRVTGEECTECGACVEACREGAVTIANGSPVVDFATCLDCGQCIGACPSGSLAEGEKGYRIIVGGKLGRHPRLARELPGIHGEEEALGLVGLCLDHYRRHCREGERLGEILERTGTGELERAAAALDRRSRR